MNRNRMLIGLGVALWWPFPGEQFCVSQISASDCGKARAHEADRRGSEGRCRSGRCWMHRWCEQFPGPRASQLVECAHERPIAPTVL